MKVIWFGFSVAIITLPRKIRNPSSLSALSIQLKITEYSVSLHTRSEMTSFVGAAGGAKVGVIDGVSEGVSVRVRVGVNVGVGDM